MDRMELRKVSNEADDETNSDDSIDEGYTKIPEPEKAPIGSQFVDEDDAESQRFLTSGFLRKTKYEEYQEEYHPGMTSFGMSAFNLSNAIMGSGILGLSYAMANTGILLFVILLLGVAILSLYSVHLLLKTAKEGGSLIYEKLGERAFGWPGKIAAFSSITMQNIGAMSSYLFIVKYELPEVIRAFMGTEEVSGQWYTNGNYLVVIVSLCIILPLTFLKNLGYLGYTSGFSLSCMVFFVGVVIYKKSQIPCPLPAFGHYSGNVTSLANTTGHVLIMHPMVLNESTDHDVNLMMPSINGHTANHNEDDSSIVHTNGFSYDARDEGDMCKPKYFVFNSQTAYTIPILAFAFVCHPEVLPIYSELKDRSQKKMQHVSNVSITAMLIMYLLAATFGYLTFLGQVETELLHTYTKVYQFDVLILCVRLAVLVAVTLTVPIVLFPIRASIQELIFPRRSFNWIRHIGIAGILLVLNNLLVIFVPSIRDIFGFIGASAATMLIFILPSACYIRLVKKESMRSMQKIGAAIFLVIGIIFMIGSLTLIVIDWIHNPPGSGGH
ncbi:sodium-coupled neutral amino acid transporter 4 [Pristis pectinata]|uniref:sodium-coupled neutral amino acid transporter 4 n=1 Tax=Pristis pectinata TaxID=685728 RepID=UPI00223DA8AF|nr:sodium-coupled neutral amino acid transporter 4 [Pristis pectinata]XP_051885978.1 sodium-coupled neutral amino acid transporter 4 [Pristis pectinata]XP_051885979.1 sodium-coupled neutral amino acid transporter 4 [Pristis pectinata]XP_051885980.1 sodium-coupled neutral amino acid transporter 4 [Pristis pectinata]XP_051885981.1 sodium-coupled neutral amino acid transporter 4 [Pristis pectinata]XP_051885982.1 sodium-coupled neutral amino acid transporter 4 [Pristis pectinata]XP_051885983.1 so